MYHKLKKYFGAAAAVETPAEKELTAEDLAYMENRWKRKKATVGDLEDMKRFLAGHIIAVLREIAELKKQTEILKQIGRGEKE